jgi:WD40 repeat protein
MYLQNFVNLISEPRLPLRTLEGHYGFARAVAVTADGKRAVSGSYDHMLKVWDLDSGVTLRTLEGHSDAVSAVAVTPHGKRAVSGSLDRTVRVWDLDSGATLGERDPST